jgi:hypothetical protein
MKPINNCKTLALGEMVDQYSWEMTTSKIENS